MDVEFTCEGKSIENVAEFKYLGLIINRSKNHPGQMLDQGISKAKGAFYRIKCHASLLGQYNRRVRISLV